MINQRLNLLNQLQEKKRKDKEIDKDGESEPMGPKVVVFIAGGMTFSEVRAAYEMTRAGNREVIVGSTHLISPLKLFKEVSLWGSTQRDKREKHSESSDSD